MLVVVAMVIQKEPGKIFCRNRRVHLCLYSDGAYLRGFVLLSGLAAWRDHPRVGDASGGCQYSRGSSGDLAYPGLGQFDGKKYSA